MQERSDPSVPSLDDPLSELPPGGYPTDNAHQIAPQPHGRHHRSVPRRIARVSNGFVAAKQDLTRYDTALPPTRHRSRNLVGVLTRLLVAAVVLLPPAPVDVDSGGCRLGATASPGTFWSALVILWLLSPPLGRRLVLCARRRQGRKTMKRVVALVALVVCVMVAPHARATDWFVRPQGGSYGLENGTSYADAFDGGADVVWGQGGVSAGDTLYVCGEHTTVIVVGASGTQDKPITLDGKCSRLDLGYADGVIGRRKLDNVGASTSGSGQMISLHDDAHIVIQHLTFKDTFGTAYDYNWGGWTAHAQNPYGTHDHLPSSTVLTDVGNGDCTGAATPFACCSGLDQGSCNVGFTKSGGLDAYLPYDNQLRGGVIFNITDGSKCVITASAKHTITCAAGLSGGQDNRWEKGDRYRLQGDVGAIRISGKSSNILIRNNTFSYTQTDVGFAIMMYVSDTAAIDRVTIDDNTFHGGDDGGDVMIVPFWAWNSRGTCNRITVSNNTFTSVEAAFGLWANPGIDPDGDGDTDDDSGTEYLDIDHNTINIVDGGRWAIKTVAVKALKSGFNYIRNNTITTDGVQQDHTNLLQIHWSKDLVIEDNTIEGPKLSGGCDGCAIIVDWAFRDDKQDHISDNVIIRNNTVYNAHSDCLGKGISVYRGRNVDVHNNLVYDSDVGIKIATQNLDNTGCTAAGKPYSCCSGSQAGTCDTAYESAGVRVFNNTVHNAGVGDCTGKAASICGDGILSDSETPEVFVRNNLISTSVGDGIQANSAVDSDHNLIHKSGAKDCNGFACGADTITGQDPLFADPGADDFSLKSDSPALNAGIDVGLDYCGSAPDIGYHERCGKANGARCTGDADCLSGHCADGVCCDTACSETCYACHLQAGAQLGQCAPIPANLPDDAATTTCVGANRCDGAGGCKPAIAGTCDDDKSCASGFCVDGICCESACSETCRACNLAGREGSCALLPQNWADTFPADTCSGDQLCNGEGGCRANLGRRCTAPGDCASGHCVDGVCCKTACDGPCESCALAGSEGTCATVAADSDPDGDCRGDDPSCSGSCNGRGACEYPPAGTPCGSCNTCDGTGRCLATGNGPACDGTSSIAPDGDQPRASGGCSAADSSPRYLAAVLVLLFLWLLFFLWARRRP